ncbi:MAG: hypothetical protein K6G61_10685 [Solobacterium sp.]|nr:hypothetical protein [Solobacterium sp.]
MHAKLKNILICIFLLMASSCAQVKSDVDVDLSRMSVTAIYSEVSNMIVTPQNYVGKTVRMRGAFRSYYSPDADRVYCYCVIPDATACCEQGIEFVLAGDPVYPDDYPGEGETITVKGTFDVYQEGKIEYCNLIGAELSGRN